MIGPKQTNNQKKSKNFHLNEATPSNKINGSMVFSKILAFLTLLLEWYWFNFNENTFIELNPEYFVGRV